MIVCPLAVFLLPTLILDWREHKKDSLKTLQGIAKSVECNSFPDLSLSYQSIELCKCVQVVFASSSDPRLQVASSNLRLARGLWWNVTQNKEFSFIILYKHII